MSALRPGYPPRSIPPPVPCRRPTPLPASRSALRRGWPAYGCCRAAAPAPTSPRWPAPPCRAAPTGRTPVAIRSSTCRGRPPATAPASLTGGAGTVAVQVTITTDRALTTVRVGLTAQSVLDSTALATSPDREVTVPPGQSRTVQFDVATAGDASPGTYRLAATADLRLAGDNPATSRRAVATARTDLPLRDLAQAFDNVAITDDANPEPGDADGAGSSFSAQGLARAGVVPGGTLTADGLTFTMPERFTSVVDNAVAHGQTIPLSGHAGRVGLLATGTYTPGPATVTVTYTDGSTARGSPFPDWSAANPPAGVIVAANGGAVNGNGRAPDQPSGEPVRDQRPDRSGPGARRDHPAERPRVPGRQDARYPRRRRHEGRRLTWPRAARCGNGRDRHRADSSDCGARRSDRMLYGAPGGTVTAAPPVLSGGGPTGALVRGWPAKAEPCGRSRSRVVWVGPRLIGVSVHAACEVSAARKSGRAIVGCGAA